MEEILLLNGRYKVIKMLGKGGMGCVYLVKDTADASIWALKEEKVTTQNKELLYSEVHLLQRLHHSALPQIREYIKINDKLYIVMEFVDGPTLGELLKKDGCIKEQQVIEWGIQIADVLEYLHGIHPPVVYRDLKPNNIMLDSSGKIRVIDLGIAQEYSQETGFNSHTVVLSRGYAAPEQYDLRYKSDVRTDIYALGVTMHYLITGKNPNEPPYYFQPIRKLNKDASLAMEYIIKNCLWPQPDKRYAKVGLLKNDLLHIQEVEKREHKKKKRKRVRVILAGIVLSIVLGCCYLTIKEIRTKKYREYQDFITTAKLQIVNENYGEALEEIQLAIEADPDIEDAYIAMVYWYVEQGKYEDAINYVKQNVLTPFPDVFNNIEFLELMGDCYSGMGNYKDAVYYYNMCVSYEPDNEYYQNKLSVCTMQGGE